eukprot:CAMPEP_0176475722 /NCGR_PEP_ID=MMETSP0127-20121128/43759_1 /TAXON_ID=938130 /ORGANISM="Platyophrya macrostoma, Strain WH" /LENGTH=1056 /DNA_ID=CAMNT_0017871339 /DNA_START=179 /DNA_END=3349 /DNA_ORIENTATION=+
MMRKQLSIFSESNFNAMWPLIDGNTATKIKEEIFVVLTKESASNIRHQICSLIGELGATVNNLSEEDLNKMPPEGKEWPKFVPQIMELWLSEIPSMMEAALKIMSTLFAYSSEQFKDLFVVFKKGLEHEEINIKTAVLETMTSWISVILPKETKIYEELIPQMMDAVIFVLAKDEYQGQLSLQNVIDLIEIEANFLVKNFDYFFQTMQKICGVKKVEDEGIKGMAIQSICAFAEREPKLFENNPKVLSAYLEMLLAYMIETSEDPDKDWENPQSGYMEVNNEDSSSSGIKHGCEVIHSLAECIGQQVLMKTLATLVRQMLLGSDWRYKYVALMSLSELGKHIGDLDDLTPIVQTAVQHFKDPACKVRWAAFHVIGMFSEDVSPEFQIRFHESLIPLILQNLDESVPRVLCHLLNCLSNFMESLPEEHTPRYIEPVVNSVFTVLQNTEIRMLREGTLAVLSATAEAAKENFRPYADKCVPVLFEILKTNNKKEQKQARGLAMECLTVIGHSIGKELFAKYLQDLIQLILSIMNNDISLEDADPQRSYIISGWQRICVTLGEDFIPYLDVILPPLLKLIEIVLNNAPKEKKELLDEYSVADESTFKKEKNYLQKDQDDQEEDAVDHEEIDIAISMVEVFVKELKKGYIPYLEKTTELVLKAVGYTENNKIRERAASCLPGLLEVVKDSTHQMKDQVVLKLAHMFLNSLWTELEKECDPEILTMQISSFKNCIDVCGRFMNENELNDLSTKVLTLLADSEKRNIETSKFNDFDDDDEDESNHHPDHGDFNNDEEDLHLALAELFGVLFKTHKELTLPLARVLYTQVIAKALSPSNSDKMLKFGLLICVDMIDYLGYELVADIWPQLSEALLAFVTHKTAYLRQLASFGIGLLAQRGKVAFKSMSEVCINKILEALKIQKGAETERSYIFSVDNLVAALGKILEAHPDLTNANELAKVWFSKLPIRLDESEGPVQHELLVDILLTGDASVVLGKNGEGIGHLLKIFVHIANSRMSNEKVNTKISKVLKLLAEGPTQEIVAKELNGFTELQKQRIKALLLS